MNAETLYFYPDPGTGSVRLDHFLAYRMSGLSRTACQRLVDAACVAINGEITLKPSFLVRAPMVVTVTVQSVPQGQVNGINIALDNYQIDIVAEHERFMIINKPAGLMVHPAASAPNMPTLVDWIRARLPELMFQQDTSRPGIVHRLDKDTSGLMIIPKDIKAHVKFSDLFKSKSIAKKYIAVVEGHPPPTGVIAYNIVRHPVHRTRMTHSLLIGRDAYTRYEVESYFDNASLINCFPTTGRTHQIRVHCAAERFPIIGDLAYGEPSADINRQALHAASLSFTFEGSQFNFVQPLPHDMEQLVDNLTSAMRESV